MYEHTILYHPIYLVWLERQRERLRGCYLRAEDLMRDDGIDIHHSQLRRADAVPGQLSQ